MIEHCFKDLVSIVGCPKPVIPVTVPPLVTPTAPLMVNDLPDIDSDMLEKVAKSNMDSYLQQFAEISNYAWELLQQDVLGVLSEVVGINFENVLYQSQAPNIYTPLTVVPSSSNLTGLRMAIGRAKYVRYYLKGFWLASVQPNVAVMVKVINLSTGVVMDTFSVVTDAVEPLTYVEVGKFYNSQTDMLSIGVVLDANSPELYLLNCGGMSSDCGCSQQMANTIETPFQLDPNLPFVFENFIYAGTSYYQIGLCIDGEIVCSIEDFICRNKMHLRFAFRELIGALYFRKARVPDGKINFWKSLLPEELKALEHDGMNRYKSNLKRIVKGLPLKGLCVDCFGTERAGYSSQSNV